MHDFEFAGTVDLTALIVLTFVLFFVALIFYLRREDRREGYPLEDEMTGRLESAGGLFFAARPKSFIMSGQNTITKPNADRDTPRTNARRTSRAPGSPIEPTGNPLLAGVGPGSFAHRADRPDRTVHGATKITPLRAAPGFFIDGSRSDPRGMTVLGADGVSAGVVSDVWIDRAEYMIRYLEVASGPSEGVARGVLVPMTMAVINKSNRTVKVDAVLGSQFSDAPTRASADEVTFLDEERTCAYFGAGYLYATPARSEPWL